MRIQKYAPDACKNLKVVDTSATSVTCAWTAPIHDGGADIVGYVLDVLKEGDEEWMRCSGKEPIVENRYTIGGLEANGLFKFRVAAVNRIGEGTWLK